VPRWGAARVSYCLPSTSWRPRRGERENPFCDLTISIALSRPFLAISNIMRFVIEVVIIGVVISLGWSKPFKEHYAYVNRTITSELHDIGKKSQKKQDTSVKPH
jgi:hypothetical protein